MKTKKIPTCFAVGALLAMPFASYAGTKAGDGVIGGQASFTFTDSSDSINISGGGSYFFTDGLEAGISLGWSGSDSSATGSDYTVLLSGFAQYNFLTKGSTVPFVGAGYTTTSLGDNDNTDYYNVFAGLRQFVSENVAIRSQVTYLGAVDSDPANEDQTIVSFGVEWFF